MQDLGPQKTLVSVNGPDFVSGYLKRWCESLGIKKMETLIYSPRANELVERAVQTVKRLIKSGANNCVIWRFATAGCNAHTERIPRRAARIGGTTALTESETSNSQSIPARTAYFF